jgi:hypothetical protein
MSEKGLEGRRNGEGGGRKVVSSSGTRELSLTRWVRVGGRRRTFRGGDERGESEEKGKGRTGKNVVWEGERWDAGKMAVAWAY